MLLLSRPQECRGQASCGGSCLARGLAAGLAGAALLDPPGLLVGSNPA